MAKAEESSGPPSQPTRPQSHIRALDDAPRICLRTWPVRSATDMQPSRHWHRGAIESGDMASCGNEGAAPANPACAVMPATAASGAKATPLACYRRCNLAGATSVATGFIGSPVATEGAPTPPASVVLAIRTGGEMRRIPVLPVRSMEASPAHWTAHSRATLHTKLVPPRHAARKLQHDAMRAPGQRLRCRRPQRPASAAPLPAPPHHRTDAMPPCHASGSRACRGWAPARRGRERQIRNDGALLKSAAVLVDAPTARR